MDIYSKIYSSLREEYANGATYKDLSDKYGVSYTYIHFLLNKKRDVSGISLEFFFKLFPNAKINLDGDVSITANHNSGNVVGVNNGAITTDSYAVVIDKILECEELSAEEKVKFMKVLK